MSPAKHPIQPLYKSESGVVRFKPNAIVQYLLDNGGISMNDIACLDFSREDREQFAQLIGYSHSGAGTWIICQTRFLLLHGVPTRTAKPQSKLKSLT